MRSAEGLTDQTGRCSLHFYPVDSTLHANRRLEAKEEKSLTKLTVTEQKSTLIGQRKKGVSRTKSLIPWAG